MPTADSPPIPVEDVSMSDRKRVAEGNAGAFLGPAMLVPAPMNALNDGPGRPPQQALQLAQLANPSL